MADGWVSSLWVSTAVVKNKVVQDIVRTQGQPQRHAPRFCRDDYDGTTDFMSYKVLDMDQKTNPGVLFIRVALLCTDY